MLDGSEYSSASECFVELNRMDMPKRKKSKNYNKRRFSDDQIRSLEVTFESHTKLEPRKKAQLAKELGLQPRQVAIWFQNKRARWKSKQIEKDYAVLLSDYNNLASQFESLKKEKQSLLVQLQKLKNEMVGKTCERKNQCQSKETAENNSCDVGSDYTKMDLGGMLSVSDDDSSIKAEFLGLDDENELLKMVEDSSLTSSEEWGSLDSDDLMNQGTESYQWWDFWK